MSLPYKRFLGYEKGPDGRPQIVESEAAVVRQIYTLYLQGKTVNFIARHLTAQGIPTPGGKEKWAVSTIQSILRSEKYKGEAILQKKYTVDFLQKRMVKNEGQIPQFHVENSHPAIVTLEEFDLVQTELERRAQTAGTQQSGLSPYSSKLICVCCGAFFGPKTWHSTSPYRRVIWQCNNKYKGDVVCKSRFVTEEEVQRAFTEAFNSLISDRVSLYSRHQAIMDELTDTVALDSKIAKYIDECDLVAGLIRKAVEEGARAAVDPEEYDEHYNALVARYEAAKEKHEAVAREKRSRELRRTQASAFFAEVEAREGLLTGFEEQLWNCTVESVTVLVDGGFRVRFKDGLEVTV